jgi:type I restriction enzyme M protein
MAIKNDLYSSLWASCDELRGGMDASQYKDYVLFMLFISTYRTNTVTLKTLPRQSPFRPEPAWDMIALKGKSDIGDKINTQIIQPLIDANTSLARSDFLISTIRTSSARGRRWWSVSVTSSASFKSPSWTFEEPRRERRHPG